MRFLLLTRLSLLSLSALLLFSCNPEKEDFTSEPLKDYLPLVAGKYITYRIDSTVFTNFGRTTEVHSYQVKHVVDAQITDNLGRPSFRIYRYMRDLAGTQSWQPSGSYLITPAEDQIETIEDNLRFIRLHLPIKQDFSWKGNRFLPPDPYHTYQFANDDDMEDWDYYYQNTSSLFTYNSQTLSNVLNVIHIDQRISLDTVDVVNNTATIPKNAKAVFMRGTATDTIRINAVRPDIGFENLTIYNQASFYATLTGIKIPSGLGFSFAYAADRWYYPNSLTVAGNAVALPRVAYNAFILGTGTDSIKVSTTNLDTVNVKRISVFNKSNKDAYCNFNPAIAGLNLVGIPPGYGRTFELFGGQWRLYNNSNILLDKDPYIEGFAFGSTNYSVEKYAKNVGMVFKEFILWEYQPNTGGQGGPYTTGFGIRMSMIDHN
ncbi:MAG: hypothetical protein ABL876_08830 [Chitinophagaceae bacterium]